MVLLDCLDNVEKLLFDVKCMNTVAVVLALPSGQFYVGLNPMDYLGQSHSANAAMCAVSGLIDAFLENGYFSSRTGDLP
jgi:hypothetical protein